MRTQNRKKNEISTRDSHGNSNESLQQNKMGANIFQTPTAQ